MPLLHLSQSHWIRLVSLSLVPFTQLCNKKAEKTENSCWLYVYLFELYLMTLYVIQLCNTEWWMIGWIIYWKGCGRQLRPNFRSYPANFLEGMWYTTQNCQSGQKAFRLRFEPGISQMQSRSDTHWNTFSFITYSSWNYCYKYTESKRPRTQNGWRCIAESNIFQGGGDAEKTFETHSLLHEEKEHRTESSGALKSIL